MPSKFGDYRAKDGEPANVDFYNKRFRGIDGRITALEDRVPAEQAVIDDLRRNGLQRIEQAIGPNLERIQKAAELGFLQCHAAENFALTFALGPAVIPLLPGAQRDIYVPTAFVAIVRTSTPHDYATARTVAWNKQTGVLEVDIVAHFGDPGPHSDLQVEALAGGALAVSNAIAGAAQDRAAAQVARTGAETARDTAVSASTVAQAAQSAAEAARQGAQTARDQAQAAASGGVKVRASDTTANFLDGKLLVSGALTKAVGSPNGNETLTITARAASTTQTGVARLATPDEAQAGALGDVVVTPAGLAAAIAATSGGGSSVVRDPRSSNQALAAVDRGKLIDFQTGFTQTFAACATLGSGWYAWLRNAGTGDVVLDPSGSEQIDGLTSFVMYPGEARLVQCDGTALRSLVIQPFAKLFTTSGTFIKPPGYAAFDVDALGGGGGGAGGGTRRSGIHDLYGGAGGAGGARVRRRLAAGRVGATESVTVGSAGVGGAGAAAGSGNISGSNGSSGGSTSFGAHATAPGGGRGLAGQSTTKGGGAGGSIPEIAGGHYVGGTSIDGHFPPATVPLFGGGGGGQSRDWFDDVNSPGQASMEGGPGGGGGGGLAGAGNSWPPENNYKYPGADGGGLWALGASTIGGGGLGGARNTSSTGNGGDGTAGTTAPGSLPGTGGGGCGGVRGGDGGAGGLGAGGGGGGTGYTSRGGNGGNGGSGAVRVAGVF